MSGAEWALGHSVIAYFDPEHIERIHISDMKMEHWGTVPLDTHLDRWNAEPYDLAAAKSRIREHDGAARMIVSEIKTKFRPPSSRIIADVQSVEIGRQMRVREQALALQTSGVTSGSLDRFSIEAMPNEVDTEPNKVSSAQANIRKVREFLEG